MKLERMARSMTVGGSSGIDRTYDDVIHVNPNLITHIECKDKSMHVLGEIGVYENIYYILTDESFEKVVAWMETHGGMRLVCMPRFTPVASNIAENRARGGVIYVNPSLITHVDEEDKSMHILGEMDFYSKAHYTLSTESFSKVIAWMEAHE